ncbi:FAD-dependent oxidoreductase [Aliihoeflea sp. PC F10.4]
MASRFLDIAVVGAGPAGLAAALFLHRAGHRVRCFERFETPKPVGSGLILQPTGLTVLETLGLLPDILALGARIDRLHGSDAKSGRTVLDVRYDAAPGMRFGLAVHRAALFSVLHRAVTSERIEVVTGTDVGAIERRADGASLIGSDDRAIGQFDLVVDATGARSRLKSFVGKPSEARPLTYGAFWASLDWHDDFDPHALTQRYDKASTMIGVMPIGRSSPQGARQAAFFWSVKVENADAVRARGLESWKATVASIWPETYVFLDQINHFDQLALARYGHHTLAIPTGPRFAVIGDAAHSTSPQLGQGANMALLDAAALGAAFGSENDVAAGLADYARMRRNHVRVFQALSYLLTPFYQSDSIVLPFFRDRLVASLAKVSPVPRFLASMVAGTTIDPFGPIGLAEHEWASFSQPTIRSKEPAV